MHNIGNLDSQAADHTVQVAGVAIVDDDGALCELLRHRLDDEPGLACAGTATSPEGARALVRAMRPEIVLVDVSLGAGVDALDLVAELVALNPSSHLLIWTKWTDPTVERTEEIRRKVRALRGGATDWIAKGDGIENLIRRIHAAVRRGPPDRHTGTAANPIEESLGALFGPATTLGPGETGEHTDRLTPAERRAAAAAAHGLEQGMTIEQIARTLKITIQTLRTHLRSVYAKWQVHHQAEFVAEARRRGLC